MYRLGPVAITDNEIVFFLLAKNQKLADRLRNALECYSDTYRISARTAMRKSPGSFFLMGVYGQVPE